MRETAAEARRVLIELAADKLGIDAAQLTAADGAVFAAADPAKRINYANLIGGRFFNTKLDWNKRIGTPLLVKGQAKQPEIKAEK